MKRHLLFLALILVAITQSGCATMIMGSRHQIEVVSDPSGATIKIEDIVMTTPAILRLRGGNDYMLTIEKEGYEPSFIRINSHFNGLVLLDLLVPPGFIVDASTGAGWSLEPKQINVKLKEKPL